MGPWDPAPPEPGAPVPEPQPRAFRAGRLLLVVALIVIAVFLALYFAGATFTLREVNYVDDSVDLEIIEPLPVPVAQPDPAVEPGHAPAG